VWLRPRPRPDEVIEVAPFDEHEAADLQLEAA